MKYIVAVLFVLTAFAWPSSALAYCSSQTITSGSSSTSCTACCNEVTGQCFTTCS